MLKPNVVDTYTTQHGPEKAITQAEHSKGDTKMQQQWQHLSDYAYFPHKYDNGQGYMLQTYKQRERKSNERKKTKRKRHGNEWKEKKEKERKRVTKLTK